MAVSLENVVVTDQINEKLGEQARDFHLSQCVSPGKSYTKPLKEPSGIKHALHKWGRESLERIKVEVFVLLKLDRRGWSLLLLLAYILYICKNVFRQVAFSLYEPREPLWDLGYHLIPAVITNGLYNDLPAIVLSFVTPFSLVLLPSFFPLPHKHGVYGCRVGYRILVQLCIGHTLRFLTYVSTSLPGSRPHCQHGPQFLAPPRGWEIFNFTAGMAPNCGDLVFSGHMFQALTMVLAAREYLPAFVPWRRVRVGVVAFMLLCCAIQIFTIIASRSHYNVDIVVACYTAVLLWTALWDRWPDPAQRATVADTSAGAVKGDRSPMLESSGGSEVDSDLSGGDTQPDVTCDDSAV